MPNKAKSFIPYGTTIFCEDIRQEVGGSLTIVGAIQKNIIIPEFPVIIPKFGMMTVVVLPRDKPKNLDINLQIFIPGDEDIPTISHPSHVRTEDIMTERDHSDLDVPPHYKLLQHIVLSPFEIKQEGFVKVRLNINGETIKAGAIRILKAHS
ncbi:DUF6941 family protein [Methylobacterium sp. Gmos1]